MEHVTESTMRPGLKVLYAGAPTAREISDLRRVRVGHVLMHQHPGVVASVEDPGHVLVGWLGLEDQDVSLVVGHNPVDGVYPSLLAVTDDEWGGAARHGWWAT